MNGFDRALVKLVNVCELTLFMMALLALGAILFLMAFAESFLPEIPAWMAGG